jgi:hypothetical protein
MLSKKEREILLQAYKILCIRERTLEPSEKGKCTRELNKLINPEYKRVLKHRLKKKLEKVLRDLVLFSHTVRFHGIELPLEFFYAMGFGSFRLSDAYLVSPEEREEVDQILMSEEAKEGKARQR